MAALICSLCLAGSLALPPGEAPRPEPGLSFGGDTWPRSGASGGRGGELLVGALMTALGDAVALTVYAAGIGVGGGLYGEGGTSADALAVTSLVTVVVLPPLLATYGVGLKRGGHSGHFGRAFARALLTNLLILGGAVGLAAAGAPALGLVALVTQLLAVPAAASAGMRGGDGGWFGRARPPGVPEAWAARRAPAGLPLTFRF